MAAILMAVDPEIVDSEKLEDVKREYNIGGLPKPALTSCALGEAQRLLSTVANTPRGRHVSKKLTRESVYYLTALLDELNTRFEYDQRHPRV